jgi:hypothetical protein
VANTEHRTNAYRVLVGKPNRKIPLEDLDVDWKVILNKSYGHSLIWLRRGTIEGLLCARY